MAKVLLTIDKKGETFEDFKIMFQAISEKGIVVTKVEDGVITTKDKKTLTFEIITTEGSKEKLQTEISEYRDSLRESIVPLMKQGIVTKEQAGKLKEQFEFLEGGKK